MASFYNNYYRYYIKYNKRWCSMATKSFLKNIVIRDKKSATAFIEALENAEGKKRKNVKIDRLVEDIEDSEKIKEIFKHK